MAPVQSIVVLLVAGCLFCGVALTIVVRLQAVGIILVVAMLVTPAATAQLLTLRFTRLMAVAVLVVVLVIGLGLAVMILYLVRRDHIYIRQGVFWIFVARRVAVLVEQDSRIGSFASGAHLHRRVARYRASRPRPASRSGFAAGSSRSRSAVAIRRRRCRRRARPSVARGGSPRRRPAAPTGRPPG